jgi:hypothetical protein
MIATDSSTRAGIYVGLTRGNTDVGLYAVRRNELDPVERSGVSLPAIIDTRTANEALADRLATPDAASVVAVTDRDAPRVAELTRLPLDQLRTTATSDPLAARALDIVAKRIAAKAIVDPPADIAAIGERPPATSARRLKWDQAAREIIVHRTVTGTAELESISSVKVRALIADVASTQRMSQEVGRLATELRTARTSLPIDERSAHTAQSQLRPFIATAVDQPGDYIKAVLGPRPRDGDHRATRWADAATAIETWRHEHGLTPADGATEIGTTALQRALGVGAQSATDELRLDIVEAAVAEALEVPTSKIQRSIRR